MSLQHFRDTVKVKYAGGITGDMTDEISSKAAPEVEVDRAAPSR